MADNITLGSGKLFCKEFSASATMPTYTELCTEANRLGYISGGASLEYTPTFAEVKDDLGYVVKSFLQEEEAIFKSGILTFDPNGLAKLADTARVTTAENVTTMKVGGTSNSSGKKYCIGFWHHDAEANRDIYIMIVGKNTAGFTLEFKKDTETVVNAEFKCLPSLDDEGTLVEYIEVTAAG